MIPLPRRAVSSPAVQTWPDVDDDDGWQDMPVIRSDENPLGLDEEDQRKFHYRAPVRLEPNAHSSSSELDGSSAAGASAGGSGSGNATGQHLEVEADTLLTDSWRDKISQDESDYTRLRLDEDEESEEVAMRTKYLFDEGKAMTPLGQMQATKQLLTEGQRIAYVGLCQLIARIMLREMGRGWQGHRSKGKLGGLKGKKGEIPVVESGQIWMLKIMARLYQHMELTRDEQRMIESLAEHGVDPSDLVPALMTTHTVNNPDFDPKAKQKADLEAIAEAEAEGEAEVERDAESEKQWMKERDEKDQAQAQVQAQADLKDFNGGDGEEGGESGGEGDAPPPPYSPRLRNDEDLSTRSRASPPVPPKTKKKDKPSNPFGSDEDEDDGDEQYPFNFSASSKVASPPVLQPVSSTSGSSSSRTGSATRLPSFDDDDEGDISSMLSPPPKQPTRSNYLNAESSAESPLKEEPAQNGSLSRQGDEEEQETNHEDDPEKTPRVKFANMQASSEDLDEETLGNATGESPAEGEIEGAIEAEVEAEAEENAETPAPLPSLPGVSTSLSNTDEMVTLDIRWTVLCDLFLVLIADSVYDARSRAFLERVALALGFDWLDLVRFENRVTDALDIQESAEKTGQETIIEGRMKAAKAKRYALMGLAAVGGGLVIGLSAGLAAPLIGAGLGAALGTVGISGTSAFLAGAGGVAMITTGGVVTGANIAGKGMARRTREVRTFEFRPLHNNKRVSCYITMCGFMASTVDDVRLPFSVLDSIVGDVFSVHWEPEMMSEMGNALKILTGEILTSVGQQVLSATVMTALMSALQWPIILTKLGYLIDNPWSNALDRARAAGLVLADTLIHRHAGIRPISLIGFSLGARAIFYALIELARVGAYGLVQDVFIFGTTVTASRNTWLDVRSVVAGRFVNGYATNDWMLGYLFRATSGGLNTVAGLRPVESVEGLENVDVTELITGHMSYRSSMPLLLKKVGFPITSDYFDEPEDPEIDMSVQERTIVNEAEEEAKRNRRKILGIFPVKDKDKSARSSTSGTSTPNPDKGKGSASPPLPTPGPGGGYEYEDDDDLPPREEADIGQIPGSPSGPPQSAAEREAALRALDEAQAKALKAEEEAVKSISKTAGFDFKAISRELGKEIDLEKLSQPEPRHHRDKEKEKDRLPDLQFDSRLPLERSGSAPPVRLSPPEDDVWSGNGSGSSSTNAGTRSSRSAHLARFSGGDEDDEGDITTNMKRVSISDLPSWERPNFAPISIEPEQDPSSSSSQSPGITSPPATATSPALFKSPVFSWNAWGSGSGANSDNNGFSSNSGRPTADDAMRDVPKPVRAAPPARPHPAEFLNMNPFANSSSTGLGAGSGGGGGGGGWSSGFDLEGIKEKEKKKRMDDEDMAEKNPW